MSRDYVNFSKISNVGQSNGRVDINVLLSKVRDDEKKQKKENLAFFGIVTLVVVIIGIIASL